jgi:DNA-binding beta-propeller fold protein YncE
MRKLICQNGLLLLVIGVLIILHGCDSVMNSDRSGNNLLESQDYLSGSDKMAPNQPRAKDWEVWALDQGEDLNRIHIYDSSLEEIDVIDFPALFSSGEIGQEVILPHMVDFNSTHEYAAVASPASRNVAIIRTADRQVLDIIETGAGAHMAAFTPDDRSIWVANIGTVTFTEITVDLETESFAIGRELDLTNEPAWQAEFENVQGGGGGAVGLNVPAPVCHQYTTDGKFAYLTLGPGAGGLIVVDIASSEPGIAKVFPREEVKANCGVALSQDGRKMYANWGDPGDPNDPPEQSGEWYVFDTSSHSLLKSSSETRGIDAHGARAALQGPWLWQVNRGSDNGIVINTRTDNIVHDLDFVGSSPDILDFSPDGKYAFVSLRGPNPLTGAAHVATGETPGFSVIKTANRQKIALIQPAAPEERERSDFHGIAVRSIF